jgi:hypothetical protein
MAQMQPVSFGGVMLGTTETVIGTVSSRGRWIFQKATFHNSGGANADLVVWLVPEGEAVANKYLISTVTLAPGETWSAPGIERLVGRSGATLQGTSTPATINAVGSALEWT